MGKYAIVKDGKVINTVEAEPEFAEKEGWISFTDYGDDGHAISQGISLYVDGKYSKAPLPEIPLDIKWQGMRIKRDTLLIASCGYKQALPIEINFLGFIRSTKRQMLADIAKLV